MDPRFNVKTRARVLLTGIDGFTGRYLADEMHSGGYDVFGISHTASEGRHDVRQVDLLDRSAIGRLVDDIRPDAVVHLAAISFIAHDDVDEIYRTNVVGTRNLLAALASAAPVRPKIVVLASSANVYGNSEADTIAEDAPLRPANDYAVSKMAMESMARLWMDKLPIVVTRPFNYTGVGQGKQFLVPKIVDHFQRSERTIELGNIDVVRDFLDVRDVAASYAALIARAPAGGVFNLCSGRGHSLEWIIKTLERIAGYEIDVQVNPNFVRGNEIRRLVGSPARSEAIGILHARPLETTLEWMYATRSGDPA